MTTARSEWGAVRIHRATTGMPLLEGDGEAASFFGLGYTQAEDDLVTLLRQYLLVRGELASVDGQAAADRDDNQRRWLVLEEARAAFASLPAEHQVLYRAFIDGVTAWMIEHPEQVPAWAPPLEPALPIGVNRTVMLFWCIADAVQELRAAGISLPPVVSELDRTPMTPGSNGWAIGPSRTRSGETLLVSDPHLPFGGVHTLHQATIATPTLHYTGFTFLGAMLSPLAHNERCGWAATTGGPRTSDAYRVPDTGQDAVELNGLRAPVIARQDGSAFVISTPYTGRSATTERQLLQMARARNAGELRAALALGGFPPQNIIGADDTGEIFYLRTGLVPRRPHGATGILTPDVVWDGYLSEDELVQEVNPESGWLQNCNSAPDTVSPSIHADRWHSDAFNDAAGRQTCRSDRSIELLHTATGVTAEDVLDWAVEDLWPDTERWRAALEAAADGAPERIAALPPARAALLQRLLGFDGHASPESLAASAWLAWRTAVATTRTSPEHLRDVVDRLDASMLLDALDRTDDPHRPYGDVHAFAPGIGGRGGAFTVRPGAQGDTQPQMQVSLRATYFHNGLAVAGSPALRVIAFGPDGMRSWSQLLPREAAGYSTGTIEPTLFTPTQSEVQSG